MANTKLRKLLYSKLAATAGLVLILAISARIGSRQKAALTSGGEFINCPGVVIDPGHGGYDGGAVWDNVIEKQINLDISLHLRELLLATGYRVALTRYGDYSLVELAQTRKREDMARRLTVIEQYAPSCFLCIHCNAMNSTQWRGGQTFCQHGAEQGLELAKDVQHYLRALTDTTRLADSLDHYLLRESSATGCLIEAGFLSNPAERELLQQKNYQRRIAAAVLLGLSKYINDGHQGD